jgi:hypothetical protein
MASIEVSELCTLYPAETIPGLEAQVKAYRVKRARERAPLPREAPPRLDPHFCLAQQLLGIPILGRVALSRRRRHLGARPPCRTTDRARDCQASGGALHSGASGAGQRSRKRKKGKRENSTIRMYTTRSIKKKKKSKTGTSTPSSPFRSHRAIPSARPLGHAVGGSGFWTMPGNLWWGRTTEPCLGRGLAASLIGCRRRVRLIAGSSN